MSKKTTHSTSAASSTTIESKVDRNKITLRSNKFTCMCIEAVKHADKTISVSVELCLTYSNKFHVADFAPSTLPLAFIGLLLLCIAITITHYTGNLGVLVGTSIFVLAGSEDTFTLIKMIKYFRNHKHISSLVGACNEVINSYMALGHIPDLAEVKEFSTLAQRTPHDISIMLHMVFYSVVLALICPFVWKNALIFCVILVLFILIGYISYKFDGLKFMQLTYTSSPDDSDIELAITAIRGFENMEIYGFDAKF